MKIKNGYLLPRNCKLVLRPKKEIEEVFALAKAKKELCGDSRALVGDEYFEGFLALEKKAHKTKQLKLRFLGADE